MSNNPKILWVLPNNKRCGISDYSSILISKLIELNFDVSVVSPPANKKETTRFVSACNSVSLVHIQYDHSFWMVNNVNLFELTGHKIERPVILTLHEVYKESPFDYPYSSINSKIPLVVLLKRYLYRRRHPTFLSEKRLCGKQYYAKAIQVHNEYQKEILIEKGVSEKNIHVITYGILLKNKISLRSKPSVWKVGTFGFINPSVDYEKALKALAAIDINWEYIIGGGVRLAEHNYLYEHIQKIARTLKIEKQFKITGYMDSDNLEKYFNSLDLYIAPFKFKSSSASLNNAISYGLPIVAPEIPLIRDINNRVSCICTYKHGDLLSLVSAIKKVIADENYRNELAQSAYTYAQKYSCKEEALQIANLYNSLL